MEAMEDSDLKSRKTRNTRKKVIIAVKKNGGGRMGISGRCQNKNACIPNSGPMMTGLDGTETGTLEGRNKK